MCGCFDRHDGQDKWLHINQIIHDKHIAVLALQETHLTDSERHKLNTLFEKSIVVYSLADPANPAAKGTAIDTLIEGRAIMLTVRWHGDPSLSFLSVYAPNNPTENAKLLESLRVKLRNLSRPYFVLGDFNMVENAIDRLPHHKDPVNVLDTMFAFKNSLNLCDGWRQIYSDMLEYLFLQKSSGSQSRIDHIYVPFCSLIDLSDWEMTMSPLPTDHKLVSVMYSSPKLLFIVRGRWSRPLHILKDKETLEKVQELGKELEDSIERCKFRRTNESNPQVLFKNFKDDVIHICCERAK
ncbi:hypothetical protein B0H10DRAFT_2164246 [Mycena sp. CBHHK59/15]|nr:hypothetical protein B0H10DRAFT_2164246 [Mycena sp. CBHHK59/15]